LLSCISPKFRVRASKLAKGWSEITLTEQERYAVRVCLDRAYDLAAELLTDLALDRPKLVPVCLVFNITITLLHDYLLDKKEEEEETSPVR
jgi:hypothetical protein